MKSHTVPKLMPARKVLVIDDDEAFSRLVATMLSHWGYSVMTTARAQSVDLDELTEADIVFLDIMVPGMNGFEVLDFLSSHQIKSSIVLMSGATNEALVTAEAFAKRNDLQLIGVLYKPFRISDVIAVLTAA
jgi:two-component system alkaline phosphatase synthesis response regulator PhoP